MNSKIEKLIRDIEKTETKIAELQQKRSELIKQRTELENSELIALCRDNGISPGELMAFVQSRKQSHEAKETEEENED